jgi:hypothetical protein
MGTGHLPLSSINVAAESAPSRLESSQKATHAVSRNGQVSRSLGLSTGEIVAVRSEEEILDTLDAEGKLDALQFMPEMLKYCGQQFRVYKRADKTCDTVNRTGGRRMYDTVHLDNLRCDGEAHGGCQAACLIFWKEAWLTRVEPALNDKALHWRPVDVSANGTPRCSRTDLLQATRRETGIEGPADHVQFRCQATDLFNATSPLPWWDVRQYIRDVRSGNATIPQILKAFVFWLFTLTLRLRGYRVLVWTYNTFQKIRGGAPLRDIQGKLTKTPSLALHLKPGDLVQVKPLDEIVQTLDVRNKNRGLYFDGEMAHYCGGTYKIRSRVDKIINERTGQMMCLPNDCLILEGVACRAQCSAKRLFCPRSIYHWWREIWLKKVE